MAVVVVEFEFEVVVVLSQRWKMRMEKKWMFWRCCYFVVLLFLLEPAELLRSCLSESECPSGKEELTFSPAEFVVASWRCCLGSRFDYYCYCCLRFVFSEMMMTNLMISIEQEQQQQLLLLLEQVRRRISVGTFSRTPNPSIAVSFARRSLAGSRRRQGGRSGRGAASRCRGRS